MSGYPAGARFEKDAPWNEKLVKCPVCDGAKITGESEICDECDGTGLINKIK